MADVKYTFEDFCEEIPAELLPHPTLNPPTQWQQDGYLIFENFIPKTLIDAYVHRYNADNGNRNPHGYKSSTPYMQVDEIKQIALYEPLTQFLERLIGEPVGLHLNLTPWVSSERNWHQDHYLNPSGVNGHYLAVWVALDDISPDAGVFEFVPGSHKWPKMSGEKVREKLEPSERNNPQWPRFAERFLDDIFEAEIEKRGAQVKRWTTAKKGDVLIWNAFLAHRGSKPLKANVLRPALISHYSGINHRPDMRPAVKYESETANGYYFPF